MFGFRHVVCVLWCYKTYRVTDAIKSNPNRSLLSPFKLKWKKKENKVEIVSFLSVLILVSYLDKYKRENFM